MTDKRIVLSTAGSEDEARKIARYLVEQRFAACVNLVPRIESIYRWQDKVESSQEWLLVIKTTASRCSAVPESIRKLHSYDVPECISVVVEGGSEAYLNWIAGSVDSGGNG